MSLGYNKSLGSCTTNGGIFRHSAATGILSQRRLWADSFEMRHWMDIEGEREQEVEKDRDIDRGPGHSH